METKKCIKCHNDIPAVAKFCGNCGAAQPQNNTPELTQPKTTIENSLQDTAVNNSKPNNSFPSADKSVRLPSEQPTVQNKNSATNQDNNPMSLLEKLKASHNNTSKSSNTKEQPVVQPPKKMAPPKPMVPETKTNQPASSVKTNENNKNTSATSSANSLLDLLHKSQQSQSAQPAPAPKVEDVPPKKEIKTPQTTSPAKPAVSKKEEKSEVVIPPATKKTVATKSEAAPIKESTASLKSEAKPIESSKFVGEQPVSILPAKPVPTSLTPYTGDNIEEQAIQDIKTIGLSESDEYMLYNAAYTNVLGFKGFFVGNNGTLKEKAISKVGEVLYREGKIKSPYPQLVPFGDIPLTWESDILYVIKDIRSAVTYLFNIEDFSDLASQNATTYRKKLDSLIMSPRSTYVIIDALPSEVKSFIALDAKIGYVFDSRINFKDLLNYEIYNVYYSSLPDYHRTLIPQNFKEDFIHYLERNRRYIPFNNVELGEYLANYTARYKDLRLPAEKFSALSLEKSFADIIGMENVKSKVRELKEFLETRGLLEEAGAKLPDLNLHMMFLGNPGIGKTTVARIIGKILFDLGYIREDKFVEVTSKDLVGSGNQTGLKTNRVLQSALGGVLFIDEAYSLALSCGQAGAEAIANIIKTMEDNKGDIVCMFAGYTLEMHDFVNSNSGISSRINYTFNFQDYTEDELYQIFMLKLSKTKMTLADETIVPLKKMIKTGSLRRNFGNGRYIDKLLQRTMTKQAALGLPRDKIMIIQPQAIPTIEELMSSF